MNDDTHDEIRFDAIRQFVIAPDRRYRVEWRDASLRFRRTGSQFDVQWLVRGARPFLGDRIATAFEGSSRSMLIVGGLGVAVVSILLLAICAAWAVSTSVPLRGSHIRGMAVIGFGFIVGMVMVIAGVSTRRDDASDPEVDFSLPLSDIVEATLLPAQSEIARRGEPQVARLHLQGRSGGAIRLGIPTASDLETIKNVIPSLAA